MDKLYIIIIFIILLFIILYYNISEPFKEKSIIKPISHFNSDNSVPLFSLPSLISNNNSSSKKKKVHFNPERKQRFIDSKENTFDSKGPLIEQKGTTNLKWWQKLKI